MLTHQCFKKMLNKIAENYGGNGYPKHTAIVIYDAFSHVSDSKFEKVISRALGEYPRFIPSVGQLEEISAKIYEDDRADEKKQETKDASNLHKYISDVHKLAEEFQMIRKQMDVWMAHIDPYQKKQESTNPKKIRK